MKQTNTLGYGLITGIVCAVISYSMFRSGILLKYSLLSLLIQVPLLVGILMNAIAFSKANNGFVTFGNVFGSCFRMSLIVAAVLMINAIIEVATVPQMKEGMMAATRENALKMGQTDDQIEMGVNIIRNFYGAIIIGGAILGELFWGDLLSLIGSDIAEKKGPNVMAAENM